MSWQDVNYDAVHREDLLNIIGSTAPVSGMITSPWISGSVLSVSSMNEMYNNIVSAVPEVCDSLYSYLDIGLYGRDKDTNR